MGEVVDSGRKPRDAAQCVEQYRPRSAAWSLLIGFLLGVAVGGTAEESREPLDGTDVLALRIWYEPAHAHVFEHALA
jgi:hypothetical protein